MSHSERIDDELSSTMLSLQTQTNCLGIFHGSADYRSMVEAADTLQSIAADLLHLSVAAYREHDGASWADVGSVVGTTRQGAQLRFGRDAHLRLNQPT